MHGGVMAYQVVSIGPRPHQGGPLPYAHEITKLFRKAIADDRHATFWATSLDDPNPTPNQHEFTVRISLADFDNGRFELYDQHNRWFPLDAPNPLTTPIQFEVITT